MRDREPRMRTMHDAHKAPPHPAETTTYLVRTRWGTRPGRGCVVEEEEEGETAGGSRLGRSLWSLCVWKAGGM